MGTLLELIQLSPALFNLPTVTKSSKRCELVTLSASGSLALNLPRRAHAFSVRCARCASKNEAELVRQLMLGELPTCEGGELNQANGEGL